jgi:hypothetical protein
LYETYLDPPLYCLFEIGEAVAELAVLKYVIADSLWQYTTSVQIDHSVYINALCLGNSVVVYSSKDSGSAIRFETLNTGGIGVVGEYSIFTKGER